MTKETMSRDSSDNVYLHKDFHGALSAGIEYLETHYGEGAVRDYLRRFVESFYAPLKEEIRKRGLAALKEHFERIYAIEEGTINIEYCEDEMVLEVASCPAVMHMRTRGYGVAKSFVETTRTVGRALCEGTEFDTELLEYDEETGRSVQRFYRGVDENGS